MSLAVIALTTGCFKSDQVEEVAFRVDVNTLDEIFTDREAGFRLAIPKGLSAVNPTSLKIFPNNKLFGDDVVAFYLDTLAKFSVFVKTISAEAMPANLADNFDSDKTWNSVQRSSFKHNDIDLSQVVLENRDVINFKLFFELNGQYREINYLVDRSRYPDFVKNIESSIGSLSQLNQFSQ